MTKTPKIEVHGSIIFTEDGPKISVSGHAFGNVPVLMFDTAFDFVAALDAALQKAAKPDNIRPFKRGGHDEPIGA